uniref:Uncharacterized protein n=1 Tax=Setaria italica TaxID=4555 RepID=K4ANX1_SETIT
MINLHVHLKIYFIDLAMRNGLNYLFVLEQQVIHSFD